MTFGMGGREGEEEEEKKKKRESKKSKVVIHGFGCMNVFCFLQLERVGGLRLSSLVLLGLDFCV